MAGEGPLRMSMAGDDETRQSGPRESYVSPITPACDVRFFPLTIVFSPTCFLGIFPGKTKRVEGRMTTTFVLQPGGVGAADTGRSVLGNVR